MRVAIYVVLGFVIVSGWSSISAQSHADVRAARAKRVLAAADAVGRSGPAGHVHERGRERHADGAAGRSRGQAARGFRREGDGGAARGRQKRAQSARAQHRRKRGRGHGRGPIALVRAPGGKQRAAVARLRSAERKDSADHRRGAAARRGATGGTQGPRAGRFVDRPQPLRSLHLARPAGLDDAR